MPLLKLLIYTAGAGWAALGILTLPKPEAAKPRRVTVQTS